MVFDLETNRVECPELVKGQTILPMYFIPVFLIAVAAFLFIVGRRHHHEMFVNLAAVLAIAAVGSLVVIFLVLGTT